MSNASLALVQDVYAKFGAGDVAGMLSAFDEDIRWVVVGEPGAYPTFGQVQGRAAVGAFFARLLEAEAITEFTPREFIADGDRVAVFGHLTTTVHATGKVVASQWAHRFVVAGGKITDFLEFYDTAQYVAAARA